MGAPRRGTVVAMVAAMLVGLLLGGSQGSLAFWTDQDTVTAGGFTTGTLNLTVDDQPAGAYTRTDLSLTKMVPGESVAAVLTVKNTGDASFTWVPSFSASGTLAAHLVVRFFRGGGTTGTTTSYPRQQTCTGSEIPTNGTSVSPVLRPNGTPQALCVQVSLDANKGNEVKNLTGYSLTVTLAATQVLQ